MKTKKLLWIVAILALVGVVAFFIVHGKGGEQPDSQNGPKTNADSVVVTKVAMVIPATLQAFSEIETGLKKVCTQPNYSVEVKSAEGDPSKFGTAVNDALKLEPDYFVAIGSQIVTTALSERNKEKMPATIAGSISVPTAVPELVNIGIDPPRIFPLNIVSQVPQSSYKKVVDILFEIKPSIKKIGVIYNESEMNSNNMRIVFEKLITETGAKPLLGAVTSPEDVSKITKKLIRNGAEAIIIPHDKSATAKASTVAKLCNSKNVLTASLDDGIIKDGIMFAVSVPYVEVGNLIGKIIVDATENNVDLKQMPMIEIDESDLRIFVNSKIMEGKGITLTEEKVKSPIIKL